jgi:hypothetical protein
MERMVVFLMSLFGALSQLFLNGNRPALHRHRYSVNRMLDRAAKKVPAKGVHERLVHKVADFLSVASR